VCEAKAHAGLANQRADRKSERGDKPGTRMGRARQHPQRVDVFAGVPVSCGAGERVRT